MRAWRVRACVVPVLVVGVVGLLTLPAGATVPPNQGSWLTGSTNHVPFPVFGWTDGVVNNCASGSGFSAVQPCYMNNGVKNAGICNEQLDGVPNWNTNGWSVNFACAGEITGAAFATGSWFSSVEVPYPACSTGGCAGTDWEDAGFNVQGVNCPLPLQAPTSGVPIYGFDWDGGSGAGHFVCGVPDSNGFVAGGCYAPGGFSQCDEFERILTLSVGPVEQGSDGYNYYGFYITGSVFFDASHVNGSVGHPRPQSLLDTTDESPDSLWGATFSVEGCGTVNPAVGPSSCSGPAGNNDFGTVMGVGGVVYGTTYQKVPTPVPYWFAGLTPPAGEPCQTVSITGPGIPATDPGYTYRAGQSYEFTVEYTGSADQLMIDPYDGASTASSTWFGQRYHTDATIEPAGSVPVAGAPGEYTSTIQVIPTATGQWSMGLYCESGGQVFVLGGTGPSAGGSGAGAGCSGGQTSTPVGCSTDLSACLHGAGAGLSLTNPASWVGAGLDGMGCVLQWAFVPGSLNTGGFTAPITGHAPYTYIADGVSAVNTFLGSINGSLAGNVCDAPVIDVNFGTLSHVGSPGHLHLGLPAPQSLGCTDAAASYASSGHGVGDLFGFRTLVRDVLAFGVWATAALVGWRMSPWSKPGDGVEMVAGAGLNNDGDYVDTFWTNEGSA
jgi:hypothetical protein